MYEHVGDWWAFTSICYILTAHAQKLLFPNFALTFSHRYRDRFSDLDFLLEGGARKMCES